MDQDVPTHTRDLRQQARSAVNRRRVLLALGLPVLLMALGSVGYRSLEGWPWDECLYMTVITMSTVGYGEIHRVSAEGRFSTMFLIMSSLGTVGYSLTVVAGFVIEGELQRMLRGRRMDKRLNRIGDHVVICGLGRTGRSVVQELQAQGQLCVAIDIDRAGADELEDLGVDVPVVIGDATDDAVLQHAGIERAKGLITVLSSDRDNVFVVLTARKLNRALQVISRLDEQQNEAKLVAAGADQVVSPNRIGGVRMASLMAHRHLANIPDRLFGSGGRLTVVGMPVLDGGALVGRTLDELAMGRDHRLHAVAIRQRDGGMVYNPTGAHRLGEGEEVLILGEHERVEAYNRQVLGDAASS